MQNKMAPGGVFFRANERMGRVNVLIEYFADCGYNGESVSIANMEKLSKHMHHLGLPFIGEDANCVYFECPCGQKYYFYPGYLLDRRTDFLIKFLERTGIAIQGGKIVGCKVCM